MKQYAFLLACISLLGTRCSDTASTDANSIDQSNGRATTSKEITVVFYNIENLFDTENDPDILDDDFTSEGKYAWTAERLQLHLEHSAQVLSAIDDDQPELVGLCEIENKKVLEQLASTGGLASARYGFVHKDSPDERGIDVALLFDEEIFSLIKTEFLLVTLPNHEDPNTRDVLYAELKSSGEKFHVFVNHWPSRRQGQQESEANRIAAAEIVKSKVDDILLNDAKAKILLMGDFNDYPENKSISEVLDAGTTNESTLFNLMAEKQKSEDGSYWYQGEWGWLDQMMVSQAFIDVENGWSVARNSAFALREDFMIFTDAKGNKSPSRVYAGDDFKGGYSDHLPVFITLTRH